MEFLTVPVVIDAVFKASFVFGATAVVALSLRRSSAAARHLAWTLGLCAALLAPLASLALPKWQVPIVRIAATPDVASAAPAPTLPAASVTIAAPQHPATHIPPKSGSYKDEGIDSVASGFSRNGFAVSWRTMALVMWAVGAAIVLGRMLLGLLAVAWMSRRMAVVQDGSWLAQARELASTLGVKRVRFHRSHTAAMPMAWGVFRSAVLMPADADAWPAHRLRVVLLHELAHVKRRDCLTHLLGQLACAAYWFNPLAWMAVRRLRAERERACDDLVLAAGTRGSDYADELLDIARVMHGGRFPVLMAGASLAMAHRSQLEGRLMAILDPSVPRRGLTRARIAAAASLFAILMVGVASVQPWAEERAAVKASVADVTAQPPEEPQPAPAPQQDVRQSPAQTTIDPDVHGAVRGAVRGGVAGGVAGGVGGGIVGGIADGVATNVANGIRNTVANTATNTVANTAANAVANTVAGGVGKGVGVGVATGVAGGIVDGVVGPIHEMAREVPVAVEHTQDDSKRGQHDPRAVAALIEALKDPDKGVRDTAMQALVQMRDPRMFDPLVQALKNESADVRQQAAFGLGQLRDARAVEPLAAAIKDASASVREQVVFALGQLRAASAIDGLSIALHDTAGNVREQAAFALGQIRDRKAVEPLISALKDQAPDVRQQAAFALGQIRDSKAVEALVVALKDTSASVREQVAFALGQIRDPRAIDGLTGALKDASAQVRQQAAFALGQIR